MNEKKHNSKIDGSGFKTENAKKTAEQSEHECPSFSAGVKKEISEQKIKREADAHALLSAFTLSIGALKLMPAMRRWGVHYVLESEAALSLVSKLAAQYFGLESQLNRVKHERLNAEYCELLLHGNGIDDFLTATGLVSLMRRAKRVMSRMFRRVLSKQRRSGAHLFAGCSLPAVRCRNQKKHITVSLCSKMPSLQCFQNG